MSALDLNDPPSGEGVKVQSKNQGNKEFFPRCVHTDKVFLFPEFFGSQLRAEWSKPASNKQFSPFFKKLYDLPPSASELLQVPLVDAPVVALQSSGLLAEDGQGCVRDHWDKRMEAALQRSHEATAMAIKACVTASVVSRASIVYGRKLMQLISPDDKCLLQGAGRMLKASAFATDAMLDAMSFASRAMASSVMARRGLWLRAWRADTQSKLIVASYPFEGKKLFGDSLDKILVETRGKKTAMPKTLKRSGSGSFSFRPFSSSFRGRHEVFKRQNWGQRPFFRKHAVNQWFGRVQQRRGDKRAGDKKSQKA